MHVARDALVRDLRIKETVTFDSFLNPIRKWVYTFMVGVHGPFTVEVFAAENQPDNVNRKIAEVIKTLRETGAIGPAEV